jgi:predicted NBD/HSP70 family sugar kinase
MRSLNRSLVLDHLRAHGTASRASVAEGTGLAKPTVSLIVEDLLREGLVEEIGRGTASAQGGRPPVLLRFNRRSSYLLGLHVGVSRTTVVLADALGEELARAEVRTPRSAARVAVRKIAEVAKQLLAEQGLATERVATAGVCLPGLVAADSGTLLLAPNLGWRDVPVRALLEEELGVPVAAHNASQTSLLAEVTEGAVVGTPDVVLVYAGTGVGAAALVEGVMVSGGQGLAGELGHCRVVDDGERCGCGGTGCLETVASAQAVVSAVGRRSGSDPGSFRDVVLAAEAGDRVAREELARAGSHLGRAASWLVNLLAPRAVVLAGGMLEAGDALVGPFRDALAQCALPAVASRLRVVESALGQDAEVRGVLLLARDRLSAGPRVVTTR